MLEECCRWLWIISSARLVDRSTNLQSRASSYRERSLELVRSPPRSAQSDLLVLSCSTAALGGGLQYALPTVTKNAGSSDDGDGDGDRDGCCAESIDHPSIWRDSNLELCTIQQTIARMIAEYHSDIRIQTQCSCWHSKSVARLLQDRSCLCFDWLAQWNFKSKLTNQTCCKLPN